MPPTGSALHAGIVPHYNSTPDSTTFPHCKLDACVPALWLQFFSTPFRVQSQFRAHKRTMLWLFLLEAIEEAIEEVIEETVVESNATHA